MYLHVHMTLGPKNRDMFSTGPALRQEQQQVVCWFLQYKIYQFIKRYKSSSGYAFPLFEVCQNYSDDRQTDIRHLIRHLPFLGLKHIRHVLFELQCLSSSSACLIARMCSYLHTGASLTTHGWADRSWLHLHCSCLCTGTQPHLQQCRAKLPPVWWLQGCLLVLDTQLKQSSKQTFICGLH